MLGRVSDFLSIISTFISVINESLPDENYSKLMLSEGGNTIVDEDMNYEMKLPEWADENKIRM